MTGQPNHSFTFQEFESKTNRASQQSRERYKPLRIHRPWAEVLRRRGEDERTVGWWHLGMLRGQWMGCPGKLVWGAEHNQANSQMAFQVSIKLGCCPELLDFPRSPSRPREPKSIWICNQRARITHYFTFSIYYTSLVFLLFSVFYYVEYMLFDFFVLQRLERIISCFEIYSWIPFSFSKRSFYSLIFCNY